MPQAAPLFPSCSQNQDFTKPPLILVARPWAPGILPQPAERTGRIEIRFRQRFDDVK